MSDSEGGSSAPEDVTHVLWSGSIGGSQVVVSQKGDGLTLGYDEHPHGGGGVVGPLELQPFREHYDCPGCDAKGGVLIPISEGAETGAVEAACPYCGGAGRLPVQSPGDEIARLESWLTLADNALLDLEEGRNGDAHQKLTRISMERMDGGWSPFDYPVQIRALKEKVAALQEVIAAGDDKIKASLRAKIRELTAALDTANGPRNG